MDASPTIGGRVMTRVPPHNLDAERSLLGAAMLSTRGLAALVAETDPTEFYAPAHQRIAAALTGLWNAGAVTVDAVLLGEELRRLGNLDDAGGPAALVELTMGTVNAADPLHHARIIREHALSRRLIQAGESIVAAGYDQPSTEAAAHAREILGTVDLPVGSTIPSPSMDDLLEESDDYDWLVPGLMERGDRLILTGSEGLGKSTLFRQVAVCIAAGVHPFTSRPIEPRRALIIDCENSRRQIRRKVRPLWLKVQHDVPDGHLRVEAPNGGLDVLQPHDHRWLLERVAANRPDLLIIGPIYKLHNGDPFAEEPAKKVAAILDLIRTRYNCALLIEAHAGHQGISSGRHDMRPYGASLWKRWPEFGYGLTAHPDNPNLAWFSPWRGDRDERDWPELLRRGGAWPWRAETTHAHTDPGAAA